MPRITHENTVNAPLDVVFDYIANPSNWPEFWTALVWIKDIKALPNGGYSAKYQYKMAGRIFHGTGDYTEFVPNKRIVINIGGGINSILTWEFRSMEDNTSVTLMVDYKTPNRILRFLADPIITLMNEQEASSLMRNLVYRFMFWNRPHLNR
ncbi:SRPBCC family protein [Chloroflexota bacterium]